MSLRDKVIARMMAKANKHILIAYEDYKSYVAAYNEYAALPDDAPQDEVDRLADEVARRYGVYLNSAELARARQSELIQEVEGN